MSWLDGLGHRVRVLLHPAEFARDLDEEMRMHEDLDATQQGGAEHARRRMGNRTIHREDTRAATWLRWLDLFRQDAGYAWRSIRRTPGVTAMIVLTLALGIGVNAATFSVLDELFLRSPAGVAEPVGIRRIWMKHTRTGGQPVFYSQAVSYPQYRLLADAWGAPNQMAVMTTNSNFRLGGTRAGYSTEILFTSANYFTLLGVRPAMGRFFTDAEARPGSPTRAVVLSDRYWKAHLGGDPAIVGKRIKLDTTSYEVLGVAPEGFAGINVRATEVWAPLSALPDADTPHAGAPSIWESPRYLIYFTFARVPDGMNTADFERRATAATRVAQRQFYGPQADSLTEIRAASIIEARGPATRRQEEVIATRLLGVTLIVLIIACANVVNLLLARAMSRKREIAVRLALGISRARLIRLITIEAVVLALMASVAALLAAWWGGSLLRSQLMAGVNFAQPAMQAHVVWFTLAIALGCGLIAGIIPAVQFSRPQVTNDLKDAARSGARHRSRLRDGLVVAQAALSLTLLVGATLFVRTLRNVEAIDIGLDTQRVFYATVAYDPGQAPPIEQRLATFVELEQRLQGHPGVEAAGRTALTPMGGFSVQPFWWDTDSSASLQKSPAVWYAVASRFFPAAGMRMLAGAPFADGPAGEGQVVINDALARLMWPTASAGGAVGKCMRFGSRDGACWTVTGVVATASRGDLIEAPQPQFYLPLGTTLTKDMGGTLLAVRAAAGADAAVTRDVIAMLKDALPNSYPVIRPITEILAPKYRPWRLGAKLFTGVGVLALLVALVGIYSSVAYSVGQRRHEFGVRVALGATVGAVLNQVVGEGVRVVLIGVGVGVALTLVTSRLVASLLYGVEPNDVSAMILAGSLLLLVAIVAAVVPAVRAARVDPVGALRGD